jgi:hypothetical protein
MSSSYADLTRQNLRHGVAFLSGAIFTPAMGAGKAVLDDWVAAIEDLYHGLLCLTAAQATLHAVAPMLPKDAQRISEARGIGAQIREVLGPFSMGHRCPLERMPVAERLELSALLLLEIKAVQADLVTRQREWVIDAVAMSDLDAAMSRLLHTITQCEKYAQAKL